LATVQRILQQHGGSFLIDLPTVSAKGREETKAAIASCKVERPVELLLEMANVSGVASNDRVDDRFVNHDTSPLKLFQCMCEVENRFIRCVNRVWHLTSHPMKLVLV